MCATWPGRVSHGNIVLGPRARNGEGIEKAPGPRILKRASCTQRNIKFRMYRNDFSEQGNTGSGVSKKGRWTQNHKKSKLHTEKHQIPYIKNNLSEQAKAGSRLSKNCPWTRRVPPFPTSVSRIMICYACFPL